MAPHQAARIPASRPGGAAWTPRALGVSQRCPHNAGAVASCGPPQHISSKRLPPASKSVTVAHEGGALLCRLSPLHQPRPRLRNPASERPRQVWRVLPQRLSSQQGGAITLPPESARRSAHLSNWFISALIRDRQGVVVEMPARRGAQPRRGQWLVLSRIAAQSAAVRRRRTGLESHQCGRAAMWLAVGLGWDRRSPPPRPPTSEAEGCAREACTLGHWW